MTEVKNDFRIPATKDLDESAKEQLLDLWNSEYPEKLVYNGMTEFDSYLQKLSGPTHFLLTGEQGIIYGWAFSFNRENERWFAIIVSGMLQGQGFGRKLLDTLKQTERTLSGWVIDHDDDKKKNGQLYRSPLKFYEKCGFDILYNIRLESGSLSAVKVKWTAKE